MINFNFYIFGNPGGTYVQYPADYLAGELAGLRLTAAGSRLVIHREMDLVHYIYEENLGDVSIGFCLVFNHARLTAPRNLAALLRFVIDDELIRQGEILRYDETGVLRYAVSSFGEVSKTVGRIKDIIGHSIETRREHFGIEALGSTYNGVRSRKAGSLSLPDNEIVALSDRHNTLILDDDATVGEGHIQQVIASLRMAVASGEREMQSLRAENTALSRQKRQFKKLVVLCLVVLGFGVGLVFLYGHLADTRDNLEAANKTIEKKDRLISMKTDSLTSLESRYTTLSGRYDDEVRKRKAYEAKLDVVEGHSPFVITSTGFNFSSGYLKIEYYGLTAGSVDLTIRVIYPNGNVTTMSRSMYVYTGHDSGSFYISDGYNSGKYYVFEILYNGRVIGGVRA